VRDPTLSQYLVDSVNAGRVPTSAPQNDDSWLTALLRLCADVLQSFGPCNVEALLDKVRDVYRELVERVGKGLKKAEQLQQDWALPLQYLLDVLSGKDQLAELQPTPRADSVSHCWFSQHYQRHHHWNCARAPLCAQTCHAKWHFALASACLVMMLQLFENACRMSSRGCFTLLFNIGTRVRSKGICRLQARSSKIVCLS